MTNDRIGYKCKAKEQRWLKTFAVRGNAEEEEINEEEGLEMNKEINSLQIEKDERSIVEFYINSVAGWSNSETMKVKGKK